MVCYTVTGILKLDFSNGHLYDQDRHRKLLGCWLCQHTGRKGGRSGALFEGWRAARCASGAARSREWQLLVVHPRASGQDAGA